MKSGPTSIILKIYFTRLTPREQLKLVLTRSNLENIFSSLTLETGAENNKCFDKKCFDITVNKKSFENFFEVGHSFPKKIVLFASLKAL